MRRRRRPGAIPAGLGGHRTGLRGDGLTGLMAVNLIRAHRDELRQARSGTLDHMVIDVVGSLFDQILSDSRVPPQMARQIARLQLPVLRVALSDPSFFSSRRHPVRRFVNRIASLACAFDDFDDGPGKPVPRPRARAGAGDRRGRLRPDRALRRQAARCSRAFIEQQTEGEVRGQRRGRVAARRKESELRMQQRYMLQLQSALAPLPMPDYLRDFLSQVWSQALALAVRPRRPDAERAQRLRRAGRDLVMSVQPKGSPALRKAFLMQLPPLMKTCNEGMELIGWPEAAQKDFFGKLLPAHAESLKGQALSELDHNLLAKQVDGVFGAPLPRAEHAARRRTRRRALDDERRARRRTSRPRRPSAVGLVDESAVDWNGKVDIDLGAEAGRARRPPSDAAARPRRSTWASTSTSAPPTPSPSSRRADRS